MTKLVFANNAVTYLSSSIDAVVTAIPVVSTANFPIPSIGFDEFNITLVGIAGDVEICRVTAATPTEFTVTRGVEGTTAAAFPPTTTSVTNRATRDTYGKLMQFKQEYSPSQYDVFTLDGNGAVVEIGFTAQFITATSDPQQDFVATEQIDIKPGYVSVFVNGVHQIRNTHYTLINGDTVSFSIEPYPRTGDVVTVEYMKLL